jgi:hypothetical protein
MTDDYIRELASDLYKHTFPESRGADTLHWLSSQLSAFLSSFALRLGYEHDTAVYREIVGLINRNSKYVGDRLSP